MRDARVAGCRVAFVFVGLESPELCAARVSQRVVLGGHDVADAKITARYPRNLKNTAEALRFVDAGWVFDNGDVENPYRLVATTAAGQVSEISPSVPGWVAAALPGAGPSRRRRRSR